MDHTPLRVADVLKNWPKTVPEFLQHKIQGVSCSIAEFDNLGEVFR